MADYITTFTKVHFTPLEPKNEDIIIEDIAHALSFMPRANGHFPEFYSVAQHCIACCEEALERKYSKRVALACLLHDASEAYVADITRPVKKHLSEYLGIEKKIQNAVYEKYVSGGLREEEKKLVSLVDDALLYYEFYHYMGEHIVKEPSIKTKEHTFKTEDFLVVKKRYIELFNKIIEDKES